MTLLEVAQVPNLPQKIQTEMVLQILSLAYKPIMPLEVEVEIWPVPQVTDNICLN